MIYSFEIVLDNVDFDTEERNDADALYEAGCGDSVPSTTGDTAHLSFDREAASFAAAVSSALLAIESALPHARILAVRRDLDEVVEVDLPHSA